MHVCFQGASLSEIKKQYRVLSLKFHPDKGGDEATFMRIAKAYAAWVSFRSSLLKPNSFFLHMSHQIIQFVATYSCTSSPFSTVWPMNSPSITGKYTATRMGQEVSEAAFNPTTCRVLLFLLTCCLCLVLMSQLPEVTNLLNAGGGNTLRTGCDSHISSLIIHNLWSLGSNMYAHTALLPINRSHGLGFSKWGRNWWPFSWDII